MSRTRKSQSERMNNIYIGWDTSAQSLPSLDEIRYIYQRLYRHFNSPTKVARLLSETDPDHFPPFLAKSRVDNINRNKGGYDLTRRAIQILKSTLQMKATIGERLKRQKLTIR